MVRKNASLYVRHALATVGLAVLLSTSAGFPAAHAGMFEFVDEMFTFREDQKPRVAPRRQLPPRYVTTPHYDESAAAGWSGYYTRDDLGARDYLNGSGSMVMRPIAQEPQLMSERQQPLVGGGSNVMIGDPGQGIGTDLYAGQVGRGTRVGNPTSDWRKPNDDGMTSRPGDFDYPALSNRIGSERISGELTRDGGAMVAGPGTHPRSSSGLTSFNSLADSDGRYVARNSAGQVTRYRVQSGDTLSGISSQPAIYGTWKLWPLIYSANKGTIGNSPRNLKRSQQLNIPRDYTDAQRRAAEQRAAKPY